MKRFIAILLIFCYSFVTFNASFLFAQQDFMRIVKIKGDAFVADMGSLNGIKLNSHYTIIQGSKKIGSAKVVAVREKICALKIVSLTSGAVVNPGDVLILDTENNSESDELLDALNSQEFSRDRLMAPKKNYYFEGQKAAEAEYGAGGAMIGGLVSGGLLGLIGWGLGYAIMSASDIDVPAHHITNLDSQNQYEFISGYKKKAKSKRNGNFHAGAAIGTLIAVVIILSSSQD